MTEWKPAKKVNRKVCANCGFIYDLTARIKNCPRCHSNAFDDYNPDIFEY